MEKTSQNDINKGEETVKEYWYIFSNIIPKDYRQHLKLVSWTDTGSVYALAVSRDHRNPENTTLLFPHNLYEYHPYNKTLLLHEFGHILTLSEDQVEVDKEFIFSEDEEVIQAAMAECTTLLDLFGCMNEDSYYYQYYQQFWDDIMVEHEEMDRSKEEEFKTFFLKYEERFFNNYSANHPAEDVSESFVHFIIMDPDELEEKTEMKYDKVRFFYQFNELVELRTQILENIYDLSVKDKEFY